jgi:hypothetical protein
VEGQANPQHPTGHAGHLCHERPPDLDKSQTAAVYDAIGKRYGVVGKVFNFFSKLRGGMDNNVGLELKVA